MSDNVTSEAVVTAGAVFATDDDGTAQHPYAKLEWGPNNTFTKVDTGAGALPIQDGGNSITVDGTITAVTTVSTITNVVHVDDNAGSLTVDGTFYQATQPVSVAGTIAVTQSGTWDEVGINDSGNSITVDGTVTVNAGTNLNTSLLALETGGNLASAVTALQILDNIVSGSEAQVDIVASLPAGTNNIGDVDIVTMPALSAGTNNIGDVDVLTLPALVAGSANIGDVDIASIAAGDNNIGNVDVASLPALPAGTNLIGYVSHGKTIKTVSGSLTADTDVIALVAAKRLKVIAYSLVSVGTNANTVIFKSNGTGGTELWRLLMQSSTAIAAGANLAIPAPSFLFATVAGEKLTMDVNQTDTIHYSISYFDDDAT